MEKDLKDMSKKSLYELSKSFYNGDLDLKNVDAESWLNGFLYALRQFNLITFKENKLWLKAIKKGLEYE